MRPPALLCALLGSGVMLAFAKPLSSPLFADFEDEDEYAELSGPDVEDVEKAFRRFQEGALAHSDGLSSVIKIAGLPGIFDVSRNLAHLRPRPPQSVDPHFLVYTNIGEAAAPTDAPPGEPVQRLRHDEDFGAAAKHVARDRTLYFVVHGYRSKGTAQWVQRIKDEILALEEATVVVVDWSTASRVKNYSVAAASTRTVARLAAKLVKELVDAGTLTPSRVHYIGHSLGAQAGGFFGQDVQSMTGTKVGRITGLDPAGPMFEYFDAYLRKEHADFVDIIHTSMGVGFNFVRGRLGMTKSAGHVDFYPNGGRQQPGCRPFGRLDCSHSRATLYYANSIRTCSYPTQRCDNYRAYRSHRCTPCDQGACGVMGHNASSELRGKHYLSISSVYPHCPGAASTQTASIVLLLSSLASVAIRFASRS
ncbi:pancreatic triacylglycerol lipase-like [Amblyomma americanum]